MTNGMHVATMGAGLKSKGSCIEPALARLVQQQPSCFERISAPSSLYGASSTLHARALPVYLLHAPILAARRPRMLHLLYKIGVPDLTVVTCANHDNVAGLSHRDRSCLHPSYAVTHWSGQPQALSNGTLSLALKHQLAYRDIVHRRINKALIFEDDCTVSVGI